MKKVLFSLSVLLLALTACNQDKSPVVRGADQIRIVVDINPQTRATNVTPQEGRYDSADEAAVNNLQVFVFNGDALDGYGSSTASKVATVSCTAGQRDVYAVVNAANLSGITSKAALLQQVATLGTGATSFQMIGSTTVTLQADANVPIVVDRHAARVVIRGIKNSLENAAQAADFKVLAVYLTNVAGDIDFGHSANYTVASWYNKRGYQAQNNLGAATYDAVNAAVAAGETYSTAHFFYSMPNGNPAATKGPFTPRACRLVIRCEIAGNVYDYPIAMPAMESNKSYEINLVNITRVGNLDNGEEGEPDHPEDDDEEKPVEGFEQGFEITVNDWTVVLVGEGGNITI